MDSGSSFSVLNRCHYEKLVNNFVLGRKPKKKKKKTLIFAVCSGALISSFAEKIQITWQGRHKDLLKELRKYSYYVTSL